MVVSTSLSTDQKKLVGKKWWCSSEYRVEKFGGKMVVSTSLSTDQKKLVVKKVVVLI